MESTQSIIIIGGGLSGLTAANELLKKHPNLKLTLLEAMSEVGGRTQTIKLHGCSFDLGAEFIGPDQHHVIELLHESENELVPVYNNGRKIIEFKTVVDSYSSNIPKNVNIFALIQMQLAIWKINRMAAKVPTINPAECEMAHYWDSMTVQSWLDQNLWFDKLKVMVEGALRVILGAELSEVSFLYFLWYVHQSRDFDNLITTEHGLQENKTKLGTQHMSLYLANQIRQRGGTIKFNHLVTTILQTEDKCILKTENSEIFECNYLIIAIPPTHINKIIFEPSLSLSRKLLCERAIMGSLIKVILLYKEQYWKNKGFSGESLSDCYNSPVMNGFDDSRINESGVLQPALIVFIGGAVYRYWKDKEYFKEVLVDKLAQYYNEPKMKHPLEIEWKAWDEEKSIGGGPVCFLPPGVLSMMDDMRAPEGRVHWAGTEMATVSTGFMDGAIESGKRVAKEISSRMLNEGKQPETQPSNKQTEGFPYTKPIRGKRHFFEWL